MYNILLIDRLGFLVDSVLQYTDWNISLLIVQDIASKNKYLNNARINKVYHSTEFMQLENVENIDFNYYKQFEESFRIVDSGMRRIQYDYQYSHYHFYMSLSLWRKIFTQYQFDFCMMSSIEHGITEDTIPIKVAVSLGIKFYTIAPINESICIVYDYLNDEMIQRSYDISKKSVTELISKDAYYFKNIDKKDIAVKSSVRHYIGSCLFDMTGSLGYILYKCIKNRSLFFTWYEGRQIKTYLPNYVNCFIRWKYIQYKNEKRSVAADYSKKYVVYFMHFEPEAAVVNHSNYMDSQLIIIKMLAKALPYGWKLYVKEHPMSRRLNKTSGLAHFIEFYSEYNSNWYWKKITEIENVELIQINESATKLITNSQAVSTIAGTVIMEAVLENKPCVIFGDRKKVVFSRGKGIYFVSSFSECKSALKEIQFDNEVNIDEIFSELAHYIIPHTSKGHAYGIKLISERLNL